jgi:hypothetical protein
VPEPPPPKVDDTRTDGGHAPSGKATSKPPEAAQDWTKAAERLANEARATRPPTRNEETENTEAEGKEQRTRLSTPEAQPTETEPEKPAKTGKKARQETEAQEPKSREPEKATEPKEQTKEGSETMIKNKKWMLIIKRICTAPKQGRIFSRFVLPLLGACVNAQFCISFSVFYGWSSDCSRLVVAFGSRHLGSLAEFAVFCLFWRFFGRFNVKNYCFRVQIIIF